MHLRLKRTRLHGATSQPDDPGETYEEAVVSVTSSATVVVTRVRPRVATPDGQFWLSLELDAIGRAGPLEAEASSDDLEAAMYDAWGLTVASTTTRKVEAGPGPRVPR